MLILKRENVGAHCNSFLQNKLALILYEGGQDNFKMEDEDNHL